MSAPARPTCADCRYFALFGAHRTDLYQYIPQAQDGTLAYFPPKRLDSAKVGQCRIRSGAEFPCRNATDWCGEHEPQRPSASTEIDPAAESGLAEVTAERDAARKALSFAVDYIRAGFASSDFTSADVAAFFRALARAGFPRLADELRSEFNVSPTDASEAAGE